MFEFLRKLTRRRATRPNSNQKDKVCELCQLYISLELQHQELVRVFRDVEARILRQKEETIGLLFLNHNQRPLSSRL